MSSVVTSIQLTKKSTYKLANGTSIPVVGYGCYLLKEGKKSVYEALKAGYRHIDTASLYKNEREAAEAVADFLRETPSVKREDIWFTTKIWNTQQGYEQTKEAIAECAEKVKEFIGYVDLVLIHTPKTSKEKRLGTWKALQEFALNPGNPTLQINSLGISNYGIPHIEELLNWEGLLVKPVVNQVELHPWLPRVKLKEYCIKHDILMEAYSPLTRGRKFDDPLLLEMSSKFNMSPPEILLKWAFLQGFIVLIKSDSAKRMKSNIDVLPDAEDDELEETSHLGKVDLDLEIAEAFNLPDSHVVTTWAGVDPCGYKDA